MSEKQIRRRLRVHRVQIGTSTSTSTSFSLEDMAQASVYLNGPVSAATLLRVYGSNDDQMFRELYGEGAAATIRLMRQSGTAVQTVGTATQEITVYSGVSGVYSMPEGAFACRRVRLVADADLGEEASTADITAKS